MNRELEHFVDKVMREQQYRNGIFANWMAIIINAIANFRALPDSRGAYMGRGEK